MPTTTLTQTPTRRPGDIPQFVTHAGARSEHLVLPPTLRARQAAPDRLQAAYRLARLAINLAAEQVPAEQAEASLAAAAGRRSEVLDLAADYLGYSDLTDNLSDQVTGLFMVEHARNALPQMQPHHRLAGRGKRIFGRLAGMRPGRAAAEAA